jgi:hypothetical protein
VCYRSWTIQLNFVNETKSDIKPLIEEWQKCDMLSASLPQMCLCYTMEIRAVVFWLVFMPHSSHNTALPGSYWLLTMWDLSSHLVSPMKDLWWTKWHRNRLLSDSQHFSFPQPIIFFHRCSTLIAHRGQYNGPILRSCYQRSLSSLLQLRLIKICGCNGGLS